MRYKKHFIFLGILLFIFILNKFVLSRDSSSTYLDLEFTKQIQDMSLVFFNYYKLYPYATLSVFFLLFFIFTIFYIPVVGSVLVLLGGSILDIKWSVIFFSFVVSISYTSSFLLSKHFFQHIIRKKIGTLGRKIIFSFELDGFLYLLSLRLSGVVPAVIVNATLGVTNIKWWKFYLASQLGTLPHIILLSYAGYHLFHINNLSAFLSGDFVLYVFLLSITPVLIKIFIDLFSKKYGE